MTEKNMLQQQGGKAVTSRERTLMMVRIALLIAISCILVFVSFPLIPGAAFLEYDMADIPVLLATFTMGTPVGLFVLAVAAFIQAFLFGHNGWVGFLMHMLSSGTLVLVASGIYHGMKKSNKGMIIGLVCATLAVTLIMIPLNFVFTPKILMDVPVAEAASLFWDGLSGGYDATAYGEAAIGAYEAVKGLLLVGLIPFNLLSSGLNAVLFYLVFRHLPGLVKKMRRD